MLFWYKKHSLWDRFFRILYWNPVQKHSNNIIVTKQIPLISSIHNHGTRLNNGINFHITSVNSNLAKTAFSHSGPKVWNTIPLNIKTANKFNFKKLYKNHLLLNYLPWALFYLFIYFLILLLMSQQIQSHCYNITYCCLTLKQ